MNVSRTKDQLREESRLLRRAIRSLEALPVIRRKSIRDFVEALRDRRQKLKKAISTIEKVRAPNGAPVRRRTR